MSATPRGLGRKEGLGNWAVTGAPTCRHGKERKECNSEGIGKEG